MGKAVSQRALKAGHLKEDPDTSVPRPPERAELSPRPGLSDLVPLCLLDPPLLPPFSPRLNPTHLLDLSITVVS